MARIYTHSYITISASLTPRSSHGFLNSRDEALVGRPIIGGSRALDEVKVRELAHRGDAIDGANPLDQRAWAFQESMLSPRVLAFEASDVYWRCDSGHFCECGGIHDASKLVQRDIVRTLDRWLVDVEKISHDKREHALFKGWRWLVEMYTQRDLSFDKDRLVALSGIASKVQSRLEDSYHAGMWERDMIQSLLWHTGDGLDYGDRGIYTDRTGWMTSEYTAPSWSWASVAAPVSWAPLPRLEFEGPKVSFQGAVCQTVSSNITGQVQEGHLRLSGPAILATLESEEMDSWSRDDRHGPKITAFVWGQNFGDHGSFERQFQVSLDVPIEMHAVGGTQGVISTLRRSCTRERDERRKRGTTLKGTVLLLHIAYVSDIRSIYLVLCTSSRRHGCYERLGIARCFGPHVYWPARSSTGERRPAVRHPDQSQLRMGFEHMEVTII
jgi:hypothetical protein